jgi:hypothetical protein
MRSYLEVGRRAILTIVLGGFLLRKLDFDKSLARGILHEIRISLGKELGPNIPAKNTQFAGTR